jgi:predicted  nucleic acid-binding Zn-ribbon protein
LSAKDEEILRLKEDLDQHMKDLTLTQEKLQEAQKESESRLAERHHVTNKLEEVMAKLKALQEAGAVKAAELERLSLQHEEKLSKVQQRLEKETLLRENLQEENKVLQEELSVVKDEKKKLVHDWEIREAEGVKENEDSAMNQKLLAAREDDIRTLTDKASSLEDHLASTVKKYEAVCAELSSTQETNLTLSDKLVEMEAATRDREEEQSKQISVLEDLRTDQQLKEKQMKEATSEYENKIVQLTEKCRVFEEQCSALQSHVGELTSQINQKAQETKSLQSRLSKLNLSYDEVTVTLEERTSKVSELEGTVEKLRSECESVKNQLNETKEKLVKTEKGVKASNLIDLELADYQHTVKGLESKVAAKNRELDEVKSSLTQQQDSFSQLKRSLSEMEDAKGKTEEKMGKMKGLLVKTKNELSEARKKEGESERTILELRAQIEEEKLAAEEAKVQVADLITKTEASSHSYQSTIESLQSSQKRQENKARGLQADLDATRDALRAKEEEFESYKVRAQSVLKQKTTGPHSKDIEAEMRQSYEGQITGLHNDLQTTSEKLSSALSELEDLTEEHTQLAKRHKQLLEEYEDAREQWRKKHSELVLHHKSFQEEKEEVVNQLRQEIQQISQAYKVRGTSWKSQLLICAVEPPNQGHFSTAFFVLCKQVDQST